MSDIARRTAEQIVGKPDRTSYAPEQHDIERYLQADARRFERAERIIAAAIAEATANRQVICSRCGDSGLSWEYLAALDDNCGVPCPNCKTDEHMEFVGRVERKTAGSTAALTLEIADTCALVLTDTPESFGEKYAEFKANPKAGLDQVTALVDVLQGRVRELEAEVKKLQDGVYDNTYFARRWVEEKRRTAALQASVAELERQLARCRSLLGPVVVGTLADRVSESMQPNNGGE